MKKLIVCILALAMLLSFAACGAPQTNDPDTTTAGSATTAAGDAETTAAGSETTAAVADEVEFQEVTVVDNEHCVIKVTGIEPDNMWGFTLNMYLENKSADKTFMFSVDSAAVNGVQTAPLFASEVAPGKKANETLSFTDADLEENGIVKYTDIELAFRVYDSNDWLAEEVAEPSVHIYPYGEENAATFIREVQDTDTVLVDNDQVTVIVTGYKMDDIWGYSADLFLVNKTDAAVMFSAKDVSLNGFMVDPFFAASVEAGKCAFSSITWLNNSLEQNSITEIESIEFTLTASPADDWLADDLVNQTITLNP